MYAIIDFFINGIRQIVNILNTKFFDDFNITYLQLILSSVVLVFIFKLVFGGYKEIESQSNIIGGTLIKNVSKKISNSSRKKQINNENYSPKHAKK